MPAKILIVEDQSDVREMLVFALKYRGFAATPASDGRHALEILECDRPDLIITDLQMPNLDGIGLIRALRKNVDTREIPILVLSSLADMRINDAIAAGANAAARKGTELETLIDLVNALLMPAILAILVGW